jgi:O-antigen/teichoic acid export membrane protein
VKMTIPGVARRAGWNLVDQVISSGTNAALSILIARSVDESAFGSFAVTFTVYGFLVGTSRAISTSPLGVRFSDVPQHAFLGASSAAVGTAFGLGVVGGSICLAAGAAVGGATGQALLALGVILPALLTQDAWRFVFFAAGRPAAAALNDAVWAAAQIGTISALLIRGISTVAPLVLAWGAAAAAAAVLGLCQARIWPRPQRGRRWLRENRDLTGYLVAEFGTLQGCQQGALLVISVVASLEAIGALRGAQVLLGPVLVLQVAAFSFAVPELARKRGTLTERQWMRSALSVSAFVTVLGFGWGMLFLIAPDSVGRTLLGNSWIGTSAILLPMVLGQLGGNLAHGAAAALIAMDRAKVSLSLQMTFAPLTLLGGIGGVFVAGAEGAAWGLAAPFWILLPFWWMKLRQQARQLTRS